MGGVAGMKKERHWVLPAIWAILLMLLLGGAAFFVIKRKRKMKESEG